MMRLPRIIVMAAAIVLLPITASAADRVIVLTAEQATQVRGPSDEAPKLAALAPIALTDGRFILGVEVLDDPRHVEDRAFLSSLPQVDLEVVRELLPR
jgi:hypothetical protein